MKYSYLGQRIPKEARKELNEKIIHLVTSNQAEAAGITREDIYNAYTGDGGLHGLHMADFDNYAEFSKAKKEIENGQVFSPHSVCQFLMACLNINKQELVTDLTCGMGNFFNFAPVEENIYGCEIDPKAYKVAHYLYPKANLERGDIRNYESPMKMDYSVGNPPFNLAFNFQNESILSQLYFCQKSAQVLKPLGIMAIIVPMSFLADTFSDKHMIEQMENDFSFLGQFSLPLSVFTPFGIDAFPTKAQFWQKKSQSEDWRPQRYSTAMTLEVPDFSDAMVAKVREVIVANAQAELRSRKNSILLELAREEDAGSDLCTRCESICTQSNPIHAFKKNTANAASMWNGCAHNNNPKTCRMKSGVEFASQRQKSWHI